MPLRGPFRFGSARHLGEDPNGVWKLRLTDRFWIEDGTLDSWGVTVYGHGLTPGPAAVDSVTPGAGSLTVAWSAPGRTGGPAVTAYDLRYIQTVVDETVDSNWTVMEDVWTASPSGNLEYVIPALVGGAQYDVQVRAVSRASAGPWSVTTTGTPIRVTTNACATGVAVLNPANNPELVSDCNALLASRDALAGSATLNWSESRSIADWGGVTVDGTPQRVTGLDLDDRQLTGAIPAELGRLVNLQALYLSQNRLTGPIPASLGRLVNLQVLYLWGNELTGPIPASLGGLSNLRFLSLAQNRLTGPVPAWLGRLSNLQYLILAENELTGTITPELGSLYNLQWLYLSDNQLTGTIPPRLRWLFNLERLILWGNELTGTIPTELGSLSNLQVLSLSGNELTGTVPTYLGSFYNLQELYLWGNELTGPIPAELGSLYNLQELYLSGNKLTGPIPAQLGNLYNLQVLSLGGNELSGTIPPHLGSLSNLQELYLWGNELTGTVPAYLGGFSNLQELYLWGNELTGTIPTELGSLSNLRDLYLSGNKLTGTVPSQLGNLGNLQELVLWGNELTGTIPPHLGSLSNLQVLSLSGNELTGTIPPHLGSLSNLQALYLRGNQLDGCVPQGLRDVADNDFDDLGLPFCDLLLSSLTLSPGLITPPFDPYHTDYTAAVEVSRVTAAPANDHNAAFQFIDQNRGEITDADGSLDGLQVDLGAGVTTIRIRVISPDGLGSRTYTIQVSPCATRGAVTNAANNRRLVSDCDALLAARDVLAGSATLNWSATLPIADLGWRDPGRFTAADYQVDPP